MGCCRGPTRCLNKDEAFTMIPRVGKQSASLLIFFVACFGGCSHKTENRPQPGQSEEVQREKTQNAQMRREQAVDIAKKEVLRNFGQLEKMEANRAYFTNGRWIVGIWMLPEKPGGMRTIEVFPDA